MQKHYFIAIKLFLMNMCYTMHVVSNENIYSESLKSSTYCQNYLLIFLEVCIHELVTCDFIHISGCQSCYLEKVCGIP